jgi:hypothetical protein
MLVISEELKDLLKNFPNDPISYFLLNPNPDLLISDHPNFLSISKDELTKISYLTPDRFSSISDSDIWTTSKRFKAKPGSLINKLTSLFNARQIENFTNLFKTFALNKFDNSRFKIVSGEDIKKWYLVSNYRSDTSSLYNSCMKHKGCQEYLNFYVYNPVKMVILLDDGKLIGRALLWETECGNKIMDRVYTIDDNLYLNHFNKWATTNGYWSKRYQSWNSTWNLITPTGYPIVSKFSIKMNKLDFINYPYIDTFKWIDFSNLKLYNHLPDNFSGSCGINPYGGLGDWNSLDLCDLSMKYQHRDHLVIIKGGIHSGKKVHTDLCNFSSMNDEYILREESVYINILGDYLYKKLEMNNLDIIKSKLLRWSTDRWSSFYNVPVEESFSKIKLALQESVDDELEISNLEEIEN